MSIHYEHHFGEHPVLPNPSNVTYTSNPPRITFEKILTSNGELRNVTFPVTDGFPMTFESNLGSDGILKGYFIVTDPGKGIKGGIRRRHSGVGEDDTGTFSGTHNL